MKWLQMAICQAPTERFLIYDEFACHLILWLNENSLSIKNVDSVDSMLLTHISRLIDPSLQSF